MLFIQTLILSTAVGVVDISIDQVLPETTIATISIENIQNFIPVSKAVRAMQHDFYCSM